MNEKKLENRKCYIVAIDYSEPDNIIEQSENEKGRAIRIGQARELWDELKDIPMNPETERIEQPFRHFPTGTHREDIWHWFEERFKIPVHDLMYH